jgi:hypothetical protein
MEATETYKQLAERNNWELSISDNRPYFMKNGRYAVPDDQTSEEDKELLANIIAEGSIEMANLILNCWKNNIEISGPCSGIREFHDKQPFSLHFSFLGPAEIIKPLADRIQAIFPNFSHLLREKDNKVRYDINYFLDNKELTADEADQIFSVFNEQLNQVLESKKGLTIGG